MEALRSERGGGEAAVPTKSSPEQEHAVGVVSTNAEEAMADQSPKENADEENNDVGKTIPPTATESDT